MNAVCPYPLTNSNQQGHKGIKVTYTNKILTGLSLSLILSIVTYTGPALSMSHEEIFHWVANEIAVKKHYPMPEIRIVPKKDLQRVFRKGSEQSLKRWAGMYGEEAASEMMDQYLNEVIGLFNPKDQIIYVGSFMEPCRQESIIAHEFTHYLQVMEKGTVDLQSNAADAMRMSHELEAGDIENKFRKTFCTPGAADN